MMRFPFSGPMPIMPQIWIALMPCPVEESPESDPGQTGRKTPTLPLDASAIVFYATTSGDCQSYAEIVDEEGDSLPPAMVLDALSAKTLILTLDSLSYGTTAMASLAMTDPDSNATATGISTTPIRADDNDYEEPTDARAGEDNTVLDSLDTIEKEGLPNKAATRPLRRQIVISMPELASMVDSFTSGAAIRARRVLVNLGLDTQDTNTDEQLNANDDRRERGRDDADYYRPLTGTMLLKNGGVRAGKGAYFEPMAADVDSHGQKHDRGQDKEKDTGKEKKGPASRSFILQRHSKTRTRPNRISQRGQQASTQSQLLDQVQSLMLLKEHPQYSKGHQSLHHRLSGLQHNNNNNNLPLTHPNNTTLSGKVAMVLMSTVCGIGVGMFGALLFVVALKVRLFQSRRSNNSGSGLHPLRHATAAQQQQTHQQMRESGVKKVIPLGVLESYGVQTVLQTSDATMVLTAVSEKSKAKMALLSKGPNTYAEDVIEMEEGLEDAEARANARLRLERRRSRVGGPGQLRLGRDVEDEESSSSSEEDECDDDYDVDEDLDQDEQDVFQEHGQYNDEEEDNDDQVVPEMRSSRDGGAMDMEQITTAIMTATRQGSYRRVSYSRQGHLNDSTSSLSSFYSASSTSSSSGSNSSSSSHSTERALTSSFSSSLSRSENPQGYTHSITHSHFRGQRRRTRSSRRRKANTKGDKASTESKENEELPFANANAQTMCSICLAEYEVGEQVRTLPCYHQYHKGCIDPWLLNVAALCPICKRDLFPSPTSST